MDIISIGMAANSGGGGGGGNSYTKSEIDAMLDNMKDQVKEDVIAEQGITDTDNDGKVDAANVADKATCDASGNDIETTYAKNDVVANKVSVSLDDDGVLRFISGTGSSGDASTSTSTYSKSEIDAMLANIKTEVVQQVVIEQGTLDADNDGKVDEANKAICDGEGNDIATTYAKSEDVKDKVSVQVDSEEGILKFV